MPVKPDSRFASQPVLRVLAPDGSIRQVIALPIGPLSEIASIADHLITQGETIDLLAQRFYGDEGLWWRLLDANPVVYPLDIQPGDVLALPDPGPATRITRARRF